MKISPSVSFVISEFLEAERKGLYNNAFDILAPFWDTNTNFPDTSGLSAEEQAEIYLRFGTVVGFLGNAKLIQNVQETSKNLLTQAHAQFSLLEINEKLAETENYLALAYSRTGEYKEAEDWLKESLARNLPDQTETRLYSYVIESLLNLDKENYAEIVQRGKKLEELFTKNAPDYLCGCLHNQMGISYKHLNNKEFAVKHLKLASFYFHRAGHQVYDGVSLNNLAQFLCKNGQFSEAHNFSKQSTEIFERIPDKTRAAYSLDTRAQIFLAEGNCSEALIYVEQAIEALINSDSYRKLVESYRTKIKILIKQRNVSEALAVMTAAHNVASLYISPELGNKIIDEVTLLMRENS